MRLGVLLLGGDGGMCLGLGGGMCLGLGGGMCLGALCLGGDGGMCLGALCLGGDGGMCLGVLCLGGDGGMCLGALCLGGGMCLGVLCLGGDGGMCLGVLLLGLVAVCVWDSVAVFGPHQRAGVGLRPLVQQHFSHAVVAAVRRYMQRGQVVQRDVIDLRVVLQQLANAVQVIPLSRHVDRRKPVLRERLTQLCPFIIYYHYCYFQHSICVSVQM